MNLKSLELLQRAPRGASGTKPSSSQVVTCVASLMALGVGGILISGERGVQAQTSSTTISVDATANRRAIDPNVYGVAWATPAQLADLNVTLHRLGGNASTRFNWQINASNRGSDWYFESLPDGDAIPGGYVDTYIQDAKSRGVEPAITVPIIGWVAKLGPNRGKLSGFSVNKYGAQTDRDSQWFPDAGNGISASTGRAITGNDPNDASTPSDSTFQQAWVNHLIGKWGSAANGGVKHYILDNEYGLWHETHRDVRPQGVSMDEARDRMFDYATKIKAAEPNATIWGPEEWGWTGYLYSGADLQYGSRNGWGNLPDRNAHGGWDYLPWLLDQFRKKEAATGQRLLDVFTVHYYPQGGEYSEDTSSTMQLRRNRSTRSLWDPNYVDESWIGTQVRLVPRLRDWVNTYYPGTKTGITEYSWGAESHINGATTQADIYGILGREGLDLATRWTTPATSTPTYKAMKLYRNYDGNKGTFGETSVKATVANPDLVSAYAAVRKDGALTVMAINKQLSASAPVQLSLANFTAQGPAQLWQLTSANTIQRLADVGVNGNILSTTLPAQSITLFVVPGNSSTTTPVAAPTNLTATAGDARVSLNWTASTGATSYNVKRATTSGGAYTTVASTVSGTSYTNTGLSNGTTYYYVVSAVSSSGESANSGVASATPQAAPTAPATPANLTATAGDARVSLTWTASTGATSYNVKRATTSGGTYTTIASSVSGTSYTNTGLTNGTTYYYVVSASNANGESANSGVASATPQAAATAPAAPTNLAATAGNAQVSLTWTASSGATSYNVKRATTSGGAYTTVASAVTGTSYTNTGLTNGTTYYYVVSAVNASGESANSAQASAKPVAPATTPTLSSTATASPSPVTVKSATTITGKVTCTGASLSNALVDVEIYDAAGTKLGQNTWSGQSFTAGQTRSFQFSWTPQTAGTYTLKVGVFGANWTPLYHWNDAAGSLTAQAPSATPTFKSVTTASPSPASVNRATIITTKITGSVASLSNALVDVEIYNAAGVKVGQNTWSGQSFPIGQTRSFQFSWTPQASGTYTLKVGVFGADWTPVYHWNDAAASLKVN